MDREIELKFLIAPGAADEVLALLRGEGEVRQLDATYFDTADHALRQAGFGLRVRDGDGVRKQTLKSAAAGGIFARGEWETPIAGPEPDPVALAGTPAAAVLNGRALSPVFTAQVERVIRLVRRGDTLIEAALDRGYLSTPARRTPVCELELELKSGSATQLFALARDLAGRVALRLSLVSKAERGYGLAAPGDGVAETRRQAARLEPGMTVAEALQAVGRTALSHLCGSAELLRERPCPEGVHQLRVAVRRMRALLKVFRPLSSEPAVRALEGDLRWLAGELDTARDLDVFIADVWRPALQDEIGQGSAAFGRALLAAQARAYLRMEAALESARSRTVLLEAAAWLEVGHWLSDPALAAIREQPATAFAATILEARTQTLRRQAARLETLDPEARHRLRLKGKTLRYVAEDLAGLFPDHPRRVERFITATKALQDALGQLNDLATRPELARQVALAHGEPEAAFAAGRLTAEGGEAQLLRAARIARDLFVDAKPFW